jgi:3-oxoacyl-[acyl-carrier-protein] synthase III
MTDKKDKVLFLSSTDIKYILLGQLTEMVNNFISEKIMWDEDQFFKILDRLIEIEKLEHIR